MPLLIALLTLASADDGYWHPNDIMPISAAFRQINEGALAPFDERNGRAEQIGNALERYQQGLDLLGDRASDEEQARLDELEKTYRRERAVLEAFANTFVADVDETFQQAVERALATAGENAVICEREIATGPRVPGMRVRTQPNPACTGTDLNETIAAALDADPKLQADIDEIMALEWPAFTVEAQPVPPVGDAGRHVQVYPLFRKGAPKALRAIRNTEDDGRLEVQAAIEQGAEGGDLDKLKTLSDQLAARSAATRASLSAPVLAAAEKAMEKSGGLAWCAAPPLFGGCQGDDQSDELIGRLLDDRKVAKAFDKASAAVISP